MKPGHRPRLPISKCGEIEQPIIKAADPTGRYVGVGCESHVAKSKSIPNPAYQHCEEQNHNERDLSGEFNPSSMSNKKRMSAPTHIHLRIGTKFCSNVLRDD